MMDSAITDVRAEETERLGGVSEHCQASGVACSGERDPHMGETPDSIERRCARH